MTASASVRERGSVSSSAGHKHHMTHTSPRERGDVKYGVLIGPQLLSDRSAGQFADEIHQFVINVAQLDFRDFSQVSRWAGPCQAVVD